MPVFVTRHFRRVGIDVGCSDRGIAEKIVLSLRRGLATVYPAFIVCLMHRFKEGMIRPTLDLRNEN